MAVSCIEICGKRHTIAGSGTASNLRGLADCSSAGGVVCGKRFSTADVTAEQLRSDHHALLHPTARPARSFCQGPPLQPRPHPRPQSPVSGRDVKTRLLVNGKEVSAGCGARVLCHSPLVRSLTGQGRSGLQDWQRLAVRFAARELDLVSFLNCHSPHPVPVPVSARY